MGSRFIRPNVDTLAIADGDTLTVRRRLTAGEQRAMFASMYEAAPGGGLRTVPFAVGRATMVAYLLDWTLMDEGRRVAIADLSPADLGAVLDGLSPEAFEEIRLAIDGHVTAMDAARAAEKKTATAGGPASSTT